MFEKLAGMTGTAETEAEEFHTIYKLEVAAIPTVVFSNTPDYPTLRGRALPEDFFADLLLGDLLDDEPEADVVVLVKQVH